MSYPVWTAGSWIFDKNFPEAINGTPVAQPNLTDSPTVVWTLDPVTMKVTANLAGANGLTFIYSGTVNPTITTGLLTGTLYINTTSGQLFQLQVVGSNNTWVAIGTVGVPPVSSVFGRTGSIASQFGDYSFSEIAGNATSSQLPFPITSGNINNIITVDGVNYTTIQQAFTALPSTGGTIDMRGNSSVSALSLGTFDPGSKTVTILLGPYNYTVNQITLQANLQIIGMGSITGVPGNPATKITATGGNSTPPIVLGQSGGIPSVRLQDFWLVGTSGNTTQNGINIIGGLNGGLWYSEFNNIVVTGFGGIGLNLDGQINTSANQFNTFKRVLVFRNSGGNYALQIIGFANCLKFENCEFDGQLNTQDGKTNINIAQGTGTVAPPYNIKFDLITCQFAGIGVTIAGGYAISFDQGHFERVQQCLSVTSGSSTGALNITIHDSGFFNGCGVGTSSPGVGTGQGYIVKNFGSTGNVSIEIIDSIINTLGGSPDAVFAGNTGSIVQLGNSVGTEGAYTFQPPQFGAPNGFGNGSAGTAVTTTLLGTGGGPANPQTIVSYIQTTQSGITFWIPLFQ